MRRSLNYWRKKMMRDGCFENSSLSCKRCKKKHSVSTGFGLGMKCECGGDLEMVSATPGQPNQQNGDEE